MQVRLYTLAKHPSLQHTRVNGNARDGWVLLSYRNDTVTVADDTATPELVAMLSRMAKRKCPFILFTRSDDPEHGYALPSPYGGASKQAHALRLWAQGKVIESDDLRTL